MDAAVDVEVVEYEVNHPAGRDLGVQQVEESDELLTTTALEDMAEDAAGVDLEGRQQAAGAVTDILERALGEFAGTAQPELWEAALQGLDAGHLVEAPDRAIGGRVEVEIDDRAHLDVELGVGLPLPVLIAMRLEVGPSQDALNAAAADRGHPAAADQDLRQQIAAPLAVAGQVGVLRAATCQGGHGV